ncbi:MAG: hypothetical protein QW548_03215, partial [Candidatus Aenigmatarchaeota archaeon]
DINCTELIPSTQLINISARTVEVYVDEGDYVNCTFFNKDNVPPETETTFAVDEDGRYVPNGGISPSSSVSFSFVGSDDKDLDHFECSLDGGAFSVCTSPKTYTGLAWGAHVMRVRAVDAAGNADLLPDAWHWVTYLPYVPAAP